MKQTAYPIALLLLLCLLSSKPAAGQNYETPLQVHVAPFNLINFDAAVLQLGMQKNISPRFALSLDYGQRLNIYGRQLKEGARKDYRYSKSKLELKYFTSLPEPDKTAFPYLAAEAFYFPQRYYKVNDWLRRRGGDFHYDMSNIRRNVWVYSLKFGAEYRAKRVVFDNYIGLGVRRISIQHQTTGEVPDELYETTEWAIPPLDWKEGVFFRPHLSLGMKLGYILN